LKEAVDKSPPKAPNELPKDIDRALIVGFELENNKASAVIWPLTEYRKHILKQNKRKNLIEIDLFLNSYGYSCKASKYRC
jgi:hypothetical protein